MEKKYKKNFYFFAIILAVFFTSSCFGHCLYNLFQDKKISLGSGNFLFISYKGDCSNIKTTLPDIVKEIPSFYGPNIKYFAVYYDDPIANASKKVSRAIVGCCFDTTVDIQPFLEKNKKYKTLHFENLTGTASVSDLKEYNSSKSTFTFEYLRTKLKIPRSSVKAKTRIPIVFYDYIKKTVRILYPLSTGNEGIIEELAL